MLFLKSDIFFVTGDNPSRQSNNLEEEHLSFGYVVKLCCYCTTKNDSKVNIHAREQLIVNLILRHQRAKPEVALNKPKLLITRSRNALNG